jgi:energy-converting hydrogenase A subunit R
LKRIFISDCEGPISKNDNAFELTTRYVPDGNRLFAIISRYDDVLADLTKKANYKAGDTLKLILPFLKAYDVTDRKMKEFAAKNLILISNIKDTLHHIRTLTDAFIVSTSYEHYIKALCSTINFPFANTYCTKIKIDKYKITRKEKSQLQKIAKEIAQMSMFDIPIEAKSIIDLPQKDQKTIRRLDEIFWKEITCMDCGKILSEIDPLGGKGKAEAVKDACQRTGVELADAMYVGDSITDEEAFKFVREGGGLTVSFNGNQYAIKNAEIAVLSENSLTTAIIADTFINSGKNKALALAKNWNRKTIENNPTNKSIKNRFFKIYFSKLPKVKIITTKNMETLAKESTSFRKKVRGESIGRLG